MHSVRPMFSWTSLVLSSIMTYPLCLDEATSSSWSVIPACSLIHGLTSINSHWCIPITLRQSWQWKVHEGSVLHFVRWFSPDFPLQRLMKMGIGQPCATGNPHAHLYVSPRLATAVQRPTSRCQSARSPRPPENLLLPMASFGVSNTTVMGIEFSHHGMYGYVIMGYNGDTMRIYTVDYGFGVLWLDMECMCVYICIYIYIQYSQNRSKQQFSIWEIVIDHQIWGCTPTSLSGKRGMNTPVEGFFHREYGVSELGFNPFNSHWLRKSPGIIIPFLKGWRNHKKSYHQPERVWPCIVRSCIPQVIAAERHWALLDIVHYHSPSEFSTPWLGHGNGPMAQWWPAFLKQNAFDLDSGVTFL